MAIDTHAVKGEELFSQIHVPLEKETALEQSQKDHLERLKELEANDLYQHTQKSHQKSKHMKKYHIGDVRKVISQKMPGAYTKLDTLQNEGRVSKLHHSRSKRFIEEEGGKNILEFQIGGSGFDTFRAPHKGMHGKNDYFVPGKMQQTNSYKADRDWKPRKVKWYNRMFGWLPFVDSTSRIKRANAEQKANLGNLLEGQNVSIPELLRNKMTVVKEAVQKKLEAHYGQSVDQSDRYRNKKVFLKKTSKAKGVTKTKYTMSGPDGKLLGQKGGKDEGSYSIENLRLNIVGYAAQYLEGIVDQYKKEEAEWAQKGIKGSHKPTLIKLRGHSRGAVATIQGAMMIQHLINRDYPQYRDLIKFSIIQYDPVPGLDAYSKEAYGELDTTKSTNLTYTRKEGKLKTTALDPMAALNLDTTESTVFYSMRVDHSVGFDPMVVKGVGRIILTPDDHSVGLKDYDDTQAKLHRTAYTDTATGEVYRSSGINDLPEGVYIADQDNNLVRCTSYEQAEEIYNQSLEFNLIDSTAQIARKKSILKAIKAWFEAH